MTDLFLNGMVTYGPLALGLALFFGPLGLPVPTGLLVLAAGAFARQGLIAWPVGLAVGLAATILGDVVSYALGRLAGGWGTRLQGRKQALWQAAQDRFQRYGGLAVYATRVLLTSLDVPTNLIAGGSGYAFGRFLAWDLLGRVTWIALYGGLGYALGSQWGAAAAALSRYGGWLAVGALLAAGGYWLLRRARSSPSLKARSL
jgi:membrane protein DedA with SNARE-associated domain